MHVAGGGASNASGRFFFDLGEVGCVELSDVDVADDACGVDEHGDREAAADAIGDGHFPVRIKEDGIGYGELVGERGGGVMALLLIHANDDESLPFGALGERDQLRGFAATGTTPRGPEVDEHVFAAELGELYGLAIKGCKAKVGCGATFLGHGDATCGVELLGEADDTETMGAGASEIAVATKFEPPDEAGNDDNNKCGESERGAGAAVFATPVGALVGSFNTGFGHDDNGITGGCEAG